MGGVGRAGAVPVDGAGPGGAEPLPAPAESTAKKVANYVLAALMLGATIVAIIGMSTTKLGGFQWSTTVGITALVIGNAVGFLALTQLNKNVGEKAEKLFFQTIPKVCEVWWRLMAVAAVAALVMGLAIGITNCDMGAIIGSVIGSAALIGGGIYWQHGHYQDVKKAEAELERVKAVRIADHDQAIWDSQPFASLQRCLPARSSGDHFSTDQERALEGAFSRARAEVPPDMAGGWQSFAPMVTAFSQQLDYATIPVRGQKNQAILKNPDGTNQAQPAGFTQQHKTDLMRAFMMDTLSTVLKQEINALQVPGDLPTEECRKALKTAITSYYHSWVSMVKNQIAQDRDPSYGELAESFITAVEGTAPLNGPRTGLHSFCENWNRTHPLPSPQLTVNSLLDLVHTAGGRVSDETDNTVGQLFSHAIFKEMRTSDYLDNSRKAIELSYIANPTSLWDLAPAHASFLFLNQGRPEYGDQFLLTQMRRLVNQSIRTEPKLEHESGIQLGLMAEWNGMISRAWSKPATVDGLNESLREAIPITASSEVRTALNGLIDTLDPEGGLKRLLEYGRMANEAVEAHRENVAERRQAFEAAVDANERVIDEDKPVLKAMWQNNACYIMYRNVMMSAAAADGSALFPAAVQRRLLGLIMPEITSRASEQNGGRDAMAAAVDQVIESNRGVMGLQLSLEQATALKGPPPPFNPAGI